MEAYLNLALCIFAIVAATSESSLLASKQRVLAKGRLLCGDTPAAGVDVQLIDYDTGPNPDDVMNTKRTNSRGEFILDGTEEEFSNIDPYLYVYHDCNDGALPCQRRWKIRIPDMYINPGETSAKVFDFGTMNLEVILPSERRRCIHHRFRRSIDRRRLSLSV